MAASEKQPRDESIEQRAPTQPIPPSADLGFVAPPIDPLGMSMRPIASTHPVRNHGETPASATWLIVAVLVLVVIAGIAIWVRLIQ